MLPQHRHVVMPGTDVVVMPGTDVPDQVMTAAILDRLLHRSVTINIQGESYRLREHRKAGISPLPIPPKGGDDTRSKVSNPNR